MHKVGSLIQRPTHESMSSIETVYVKSTRYMNALVFSRCAPLDTFIPSHCSLFTGANPCIFDNVSFECIPGLSLAAPALVTF